jgi:hypothetical protein
MQQKSGISLARVNRELYRNHHSQQPTSSPRHHTLFFLFFGASGLGRAFLNRLEVKTIETPL